MTQVKGGKRYNYADTMTGSKLAALRWYHGGTVDFLEMSAMPTKMKILWPVSKRALSTKFINIPSHKFIEQPHSEYRKKIW